MPCKHTHLHRSMVCKDGYKTTTTTTTLPNNNSNREKTITITATATATATRQHFVSLYVKKLMLSTTWPTLALRQYWHWKHTEILEFTVWANEIGMGMNKYDRKQSAVAF